MTLGTPTTEGLGNRELMRADVVTNYSIDATQAAAPWPDTTHYKVIVPAGYAYYFYGGCFYRGVAATGISYVYDSGNHVVLALGSAASAASLASYPDSTLGNVMLPIKVEAGAYIQVTFNNAQNANSYASCYCLKVKC